MWETTLRTSTSPATALVSVCPHCDGAGYYERGGAVRCHPHFGVLFPCGCKLAEQALNAYAQSIRRWHAWLVGCGFLAATRLADIVCDRPLDPLVEWCGVRADRDQQREGLDRAVADARRYLARPEGGVFICGPNGAGKTMLAAAILNELA